MSEPAFSYFRRRISIRRRSFTSPIDPCDRVWSTGMSCAPDIGRIRENRSSTRLSCSSRVTTATARERRVLCERDFVDEAPAAFLLRRVCELSVSLLAGGRRIRTLGPAGAIARQQDTL